MVKSFGCCEVCGYTVTCHDTPSKNLPKTLKVVDDLNDIKFSKANIINIIAQMKQDLYLWSDVDDTAWIEEHIINRKP